MKDDFSIKKNCGRYQNSLAINQDVLPKKIRFWDFVNNISAPVLLTLERGKELAWHRFKLTDDGYCDENKSYKWEDGKNYITLELVETGIDNNGPYERRKYLRAQILKHLSCVGYNYPVYRVSSFCTDRHDVELVYWVRNSDRRFPHVVNEIEKGSVLLQTHDETNCQDTTNNSKENKEG